MLSLQRHVTWYGPLLLLMVLVATGAALAQSNAPVDVKSAVGLWSGNGWSAAGTNHLEWKIQEDGTVEIVVTTQRGPLSGRARISVKDGMLFYESGNSSGPVTVSEVEGRRVLKYEAVMKKDGSRGGAELTLVK